MRYHPADLELTLTALINVLGSPERINAKPVAELHTPPTGHSTVPDTAKPLIGVYAGTGISAAIEGSDPPGSVVRREHAEGGGAPRSTADSIGPRALGHPADPGTLDGDRAPIADDRTPIEDLSTIYRRSNEDLLNIYRSRSNVY